MACFLVPGAEAVVITAIQIFFPKRARELRLSWLSTMLWGGVILLMIEHIWHGEVVPWPPFLTAMQNPADIPPMLHEMATIGTAMAAAVTFLWLVFLVYDSVTRSEVVPG